MSVNFNNTRKPFPIELFSQLEVDEDNFIFDGNRLMGELIFPFIQEVCEFESDKLERLLKDGIEIKGYENYTINKQGIPVENIEHPGYPEDSLTRDVFFLIYYKNICVGHHDRHEIEELDDGYLERLEELGIEYSFKWGYNTKTISNRDELKRMLREGVKIDGYENFFINEEGTPFEKIDIKGYPNGTLLRDIYDNVFYKGVCIGEYSRALANPTLNELYDDDVLDLKVAGIKYSYKWGIDETR